MSGVTKDELDELERRHVPREYNEGVCDFCEHCASESFIDDSDAVWPCATARLLLRARALEAALAEIDALHQGTVHPGNCYDHQVAVREVLAALTGDA